MNERTQTPLAILFADVCGSTRLYDRLGDVRAQDVVARCLSIMAEATRRNRGSVIKTIGDEVMSTFQRVDDAAQAAAEMQEDIADTLVVDGEVIALFPEGAVHGPDNPARALRPGVARLARLARCPVVPARVSGVRRPGRVFPALVLRGAARLEAGAPFRCEGVDTEHCLEEVAAAIGTAG